MLFGVRETASTVLYSENTKHTVNAPFFRRPRGSSGQRSSSSEWGDGRYRPPSLRAATKSLRRRGGPRRSCRTVGCFESRPAGCCMQKHTQSVDGQMINTSKWAHEIMDAENNGYMNRLLSPVCDEIRLSVGFVTVGFLRICRHFMF